MNESNKSPTEASTRPEGNTPMRPSALERGIGENIAAKLKDINPDATVALRDAIDRKQRQGGGHARD
jgi:hypothetical protein